MRKRPKSQLLLDDLPQPREAMWLDDQEEDDQNPEGRDFNMLGENRRQIEPIHQYVFHSNWHENNKTGAEERAKDASQTANDDHEQNEE